MCAVESEHSALVCDVAIDRVRQKLAQRFPSGVTYTLVEGQGTRIQADPTVDRQQFTQVLQRAITDAQTAERR